MATQANGPGSRWTEPGMPGQNLRVLLAEDEVALRLLALKVLSNHGYRVTCAENGEQAWQALQAQDFDLLVTDIQMPKMTGNELVKKVLISRPGLPVLMMSGYNPEGQVPDEVLFLPKPFTPQQLVEKVAALHLASPEA
ncbi:response regulator [bacterium]|nr:response regulator [bacterium]